jgi:electron transport complex protein RnfG
MKNMVKLGASLAAYAVVACVLLAVVNNVTAPLIANAKAAEANAGMFEIFADANDFELAADFTPDTETPVQVETLYLAKQDGEVVGGVVQATGPTYDKATILIGVNLRRTITSIKFLSLSDTPGYGQRALSEPAFTEQFADKSVNDNFEAGDDLEALSGATITTKGVADIVKYASYVAATYLAENHGGTPARRGRAPAVAAAPAATVFAYDDAYVSLFPPDTYSGAEFTEVTDAVGSIVRNMLIVKQVTVSVGGSPVGAMVAVQGQSYHGPGIVLSAVDLDGNLLGARITELNDTARIGGRALAEEYWRQFSGKRADEPLLAGANYDTLSGASITADCVADMAKVGAVEAAKLAAKIGGAAYTAGDDYPLNEHYLID